MSGSVGSPVPRGGPDAVLTRRPGAHARRAVPASPGSLATPPGSPATPPGCPAAPPGSATDQAGPRERAAGPAAPRGIAPEVLEQVRAVLARDGGTPGPARVAAALRTTGRVLGDTEVLAVVTALQAELTGAGPLQALLAEAGVSDVLVNGPDSVWVDRGGGLTRVSARFADEAAVRRLAQRLAAQAGRRLDDAAPWVDARLPDGTRLHAVLPPIAVAGTAISLRVPARRAFGLEDLVAAGFVPAAGAQLLAGLVAARCSFVVSGGTGTGKTTLLSCLLGLVDPSERIVLVEDAPELAPRHPHVVHLAARPANVEGEGAVALGQLVRQALRMRPDRLVVGEVRGAEVADMLAAMNTGHEGGCGTVHANSAVDVPVRIEALAGTAGLDRAAAHSQLASALDVVVHLVRDRTGLRRLAEVHVVDRGPDGWVRTVPAVGFRGPELVRGPGAARLDAVLGRGRR